MANQNKESATRSFVNVLKDINEKRGTEYPEDGFYIHTPNGDRFVNWNDIGTYFLTGARGTGFANELHTYLDPETIMATLGSKIAEHEVLFLDPDAFTIFNLDTTGKSLGKKTKRRT